MRDAARFTSKQAVVTCLAPDVCLTPMGSSSVAVPYMIVSRLEWSERTVGNVLFGGDEAFTMHGRTSTVTGNEPGSNGGVSSSVNVGYCRPITNKSSFYVKGSQVVQHDCLFDMNCAGADGAANTVGRLVFVDM